MKSKNKNVRRRSPSQRRSEETVRAVLDSVTKLLKGGGIRAVTTNRIAETAGVSIGSVYQYFPNKEAIFARLHDRHVEEMERIVDTRLAEHANSPLDVAMRGLVEAMIAAHAVDPELHRLLFSQVSHGVHTARPVESHLRRALRRTLESRLDEVSPSRPVERILFVLTHMVEALAHGAVLGRPPRLSLAAATEEAVHAVLVDLRA